MASCKDCIHYEDMCKEHLIECAEHGEAERILNPCVKFKNKADFVEVVRCFNCVFYDIEDYNCREFDCNMPCDGYCSKGTPKERGGEK